ncbi:hypothetical protein HHL16_18795 [Pseudoflavitalea sp. G-6-1-2]|uniref:MutS-related protein n=1 Tax=Pseudoflavitalea sp. G-6-1-2 TaxID=2728841 RepID=UPI00146E1141|nr:hypothetical protein [Pseudoflavitalea sp. G-6-1-2]NML22933.1 hypothetical protein [Pseudoflavitalea sp. G-6-1-2]
MSFTTDKQTLDDLDLLGKYKGSSILNLFDNTRTRGGAQVLSGMFQQPLQDAAAINARAATFSWFQQLRAEFPVTKELCEETEQYLGMASANSLPGTAMKLVQKKLMKLIASDQEFELIRTGMLSVQQLLQKVNAFFISLNKQPEHSPWQPVIGEVIGLLNTEGFSRLMEQESGASMPLSSLIRYDHLLRVSCRSALQRILEILYEADVYIAVSRLAASRNFTYAKALPFTEGANKIDIIKLAHPQVPGAVANSVQLHHHQNLVFLTGANMAGKSTFMKSVGVAVYLAHMGFPVAAERMEFSVLDGMYTSINVSDNLDMGYSHFYAEVLRVKRVAEEVSLGKNLLIIFDELFKGTNVKDAYDATVAVTEAFGENRNCSFIVSTHIVEAGHTLQERCTNMQFLYFPTIMEGQVPRYTYQLQQGISADKHGMMIISNEHIIDIIRQKRAAIV